MIELDPVSPDFFTDGTVVTMPGRPDLGRYKIVKRKQVKAIALNEAGELRELRMQHLKRCADQSWDVEVAEYTPRVGEVVRFSEPRRPELRGLFVVADLGTPTKLVKLGGEERGNYVYKGFPTELERVALDAVAFELAGMSA